MPFQRIFIVASISIMLSGCWFDDPKQDFGFYQKARIAVDKKDYKTAEKTLQNSLNIIDRPQANALLALLYLQGNGVKKDTKRGLKHLTKAAKKNNIDSEYTLGVIYLEGKLAPVNLKVGTAWLKKAANQGHIEAQALLGDMYFQGKWVAKDRVEAKIWLKKAANQGHIEAQINLGWVYFGKNNDTALYWLEKAAQQGSAFAQYAYSGFISGSMMSLKHEKLKSEMYKILSAENGYKEAILDIKKFPKKLSAAETKKLNNMLHAWRKKYQKK